VGPPEPGDADYPLVSARLRFGTGGRPVDAVATAHEVCRRLTLQDAGGWDERRVRADPALQAGRGRRYWAVTGRTPPAVTPAEVLAEVVRAERWAGRLLRRKWPEVVTVTEALLRSGGRVLTGAEVAAAAATGPAAVAARLARTRGVTKPAT
jgi:hypothetical protein